MWKAAKFLDSQTSSSFARVPPIKKADTEGEFATENHEIGKELLQAFFPTPPREQEEDRAVYNQLYCEPIAKHEVKAAVFRASPDKAPGRDGMPARVWRELWPVLGDEIALLFARSLETGARGQSIRMPAVGSPTEGRDLRRRGASSSHCRGVQARTGGYIRGCISAQGQGRDWRIRNAVSSAHLENGGKLRSGGRAPHGAPGDWRGSQLAVGPVMYGPR